MRGQDITDLILLAAIWGSSFLFISIAVHDFGPFALMALRTGIGLAILLPLLLWRHALPDLVRHWKPIFIVGIINAAVPFTLLAYAAFVIPAGVLSILNAATPLWGALFAALWIKDILPTWRIAGLVIGFCGMVLLVWDELEIDALIGTGLGLAAGLAAPMSYGLSSTFTNRYLMGVKSIAVATGALMSATLALAPLAFFYVARRRDQSAIVGCASDARYSLHGCYIHHFLSLGDERGTGACKHSNAFDTRVWGVVGLDVAPRGSHWRHSDRHGDHPRGHCAGNRYCWGKAVQIGA